MYTGAFPFIIGVCAARPGSPGRMPGLNGVLNGVGIVFSIGCASLGRSGVVKDEALV